MTDSKKAPVEAATAAPGEKRSVSRPLAKAAESGDPAVHQLLGAIYTAEQNGDDTAALREELAKLGFE